MNGLSIKALLIISLAMLATGCKLALTVTAGGDVTSLSGNRDCAGGSLCEYEVTDTNFSETFTAVPRPGYVFSKWQGGDDYQCAESTNPTCTISTIILETFEGPASEVVIDTIIASGRYFYVQPLFTFVGIDTDEDGTKDYLDPDDDNDGVLDADDNCPLEGPNLDGFGCPYKLVFLTSGSYKGNLGGLEGADQTCNTLAAAANLPGTYKAWLSNGTESPNTRFTRYSGSYALINGTVIASNYADLVDGAISAQINVTETGTTFTGSVWTNTSSSGNRISANTSTNTCANWSDNGFYNSDLRAAAGSNNAPATGITSSHWSYRPVTSGYLMPYEWCNFPKRLYCFEQ